MHAEVCPGCGAILQSDDPNKIGYIPKAFHGSEDALCLRCYKLVHYGEVITYEQGDPSFRSMLEGVAIGKIVFWLIDLFNLETSLNMHPRRLLGEDSSYVIVNKGDLLPDPRHIPRILDYVEKRLREQGSEPEGLFLISASTGLGMEPLTRLFQSLDRDGLIFGATNVGKSTFLSRLLTMLGQTPDSPRLTTAYVPGTTLGLIKIAFSEKLSLWDSPGLVLNDDLTTRLSPRALKAVIPRRKLKPHTYQLHPGQTLFLGGLARIDFLEGPLQSFVVYASEGIRIHRTKQVRADYLTDHERGKLLVPPYPGEKILSVPFVRTTLAWRNQRGEKKDVAIHGLGWVTLTGAHAVLDVYTPEGVGVSLRPALI
ncbi:MAG: ribosome biogenesis GTPase YqeH [Candidatus Carbobacillus altaicus]|uniref:GTP-binding protein YqeH, required for biogenesis of 30S ribosome subunit n=1 Tax=Candidatus Carbonibacillus altaicus TaxID=2163959 RepID=A0A2R6Y1A9_9BACL|nr:ribosome biogenesis GTPase YqeH [Candidatus Carbobacillus altaicus]PTQ56468.1 MAG: GTP-binding protein YqeH, required for biogenesis of 30S ribosome subunit [Candidatus Carbobacillus altaicus]